MIALPIVVISFKATEAKSCRFVRRVDGEENSVVDSIEVVFVASWAFVRRVDDEENPVVDGVEMVFVASCNMLVIYQPITDHNSNNDIIKKTRSRK